MKEKVVQREKRTDFMGFFRNLWKADSEVINNDDDESSKVISESADISPEVKEDLLKSLNKFIKLEKNYANNYKGHHVNSKKVVDKVNVDKSIGGYGAENLKNESYKTYDSNSIDKTR